MSLAAAEQHSYADFLSKVPELTYCASLHIMPMDVRAAFQADLSLVFPFLDLILGGTGSDPIDPRELTEIEEQIFETVVRLIARDLQSTWAPLIPIDIQFEQRQQYTQVQNLMLPLEKILCLRFDIRLSDATGSIHLALPAVVANTLLRKLSAQWSVTQRLPSREMRRQLRERLLESRFAARLNLPSCPLTIRQLVALEPGSVLVLPKRVSDPVHLDVAGKAMFLAYPVRFGGKRGARIEQRLSIANHKGKEK
jgi:flagellar motor switch protein FliM